MEGGYDVCGGVASLGYILSGGLRLACAGLIALFGLFCYYTLRSMSFLKSRCLSTMGKEVMDVVRGREAGRLVLC